MLGLNEVNELALSITGGNISSMFNDYGMGATINNHLSHSNGTIHPS
jgi:hypothetical protein